MKKEDYAVFIVPTGIGAKIGGFAGDAGRYARMLSEKIPLIVNPNAVNGAMFSAINDNMLYVEGFTLNEFFKENILLKPKKKNKIGIIFDKAIPTNILNIHINTLNAMKMVYGIDILGYEKTDEEVESKILITPDGISSGEINNPETLLKATEILIKKGAEAIGVVCLLKEDIDNPEYENGIGIDPIGGIEAIISHLIGKTFNIPVAHAPTFEKIELEENIVNEKSASEYICTTFLPCIIHGLYNAPKIVKKEKKTEELISLENIKALIMPYNSLGCIPVLKAVEKNIKVFAVKENLTILDVNASKLNLCDKIIEVDKYEEVLNYL